MKLNLKLPDGSVKEIEHTDAQATLDQQVKAAFERGQQSQLEAHATALGLEPKDAARPPYHPGGPGQRRQAVPRRPAGQALGADPQRGGQRRQGQKAAERTKRAFGAMPIQDIRDEVERLEAVRDEPCPAAASARTRPPRPKATAEGRQA